jgi:hypothetical protein
MELIAADIAKEWIVQTFGHEEKLLENILERPFCSIFMIHILKEQQTRSSSWNDGRNSRDLLMPMYIREH